jgi:hypothetical protein
MRHEVRVFDFGWHADWNASNRVSVGARDQVLSAQSFLALAGVKYPLESTSLKSKFRASIPFHMLNKIHQTASRSVNGFRFYSKSPFFTLTTVNCPLESSFSEIEFRGFDPVTHAQQNASNRVSIGSRVPISFQKSASPSYKCHLSCRWDSLVIENRGFDLESEAQKNASNRVSIG